MMRCRDLAIFVLTTKPITSPLAHARGLIIISLNQLKSTIYHICIAVGTFLQITAESVVHQELKS